MCEAQLALDGCEGHSQRFGRLLQRQAAEITLLYDLGLALIQRSNVLPVGEKLRYEVSPAAYSMTYRAPNARTPLYYDWLRGQLFTWDPALKRLARIRRSIDRQSGALDGDIVNSDDQSLARIGMMCRKADPKDLAPPKF